MSIRVNRMVTLLPLLIVLATVAVPGAPAVQISPFIDIPLPPDSNLFAVGGGVQASARWTLPDLQPLSAGITASIRFSPMDREILGSPGSLTIFSGLGSIKLPLLLGKGLEFLLTGSGGYYYASEKGDPLSWATNFVLGGGIGLGCRITGNLAAGLIATYRNYLRLYHMLSLEPYIIYKL